jgi:hypothetical protein
MGLLDRIIKQEIKGQSPESIAEEERLAREQEYMQYQRDAEMAASGMMGSSIGQPLPQPRQFQMPPSFEKETMELYLKPKLPTDINDLDGKNRFWVYTNESSLTNNITSNDNHEGVIRKLTSLRTALDFQGCDNCNNLIQDCMLLTHAEIVMNKARSDFTDGFRERIVPSVGLSMVGNYPTNAMSAAERPHDSKLGWGLLGQRQQR